MISKIKKKYKKFQQFLFPSLFLSLFLHTVITRQKCNHPFHLYNKMKEKIKEEKKERKMFITFPHIAQLSLQIAFSTNFDMPGE